MKEDYWRICYVFLWKDPPFFFFFLGGGLLFLAFFLRLMLRHFTNHITLDIAPRHILLDITTRNTTPNNVNLLVVRFINIELRTFLPDTSTISSVVEKKGSLDICLMGFICILHKFVKSPVRHLGLTIGNV